MRSVASRVRRLAAGSLVVTAVCAGCGSSASGNGSPSSSAAPTSAPTSAVTSAASGGDVLKVEGAVTGTLTEGSSGSSCSSEGSGTTSGIIQLSGAGGSYVLQFRLPTGSTTFPHSGGDALVTFYNVNDSKNEWAAGTNASPGLGTAAFSAAKKGTIEATLGYNPPSKRAPALGPVKMSGSWTCP